MLFISTSGTPVPRCGSPFVCSLTQLPVLLSPGCGSKSSALDPFPAPLLVCPLCACSVPVFLLLAGSGRSHPSARAGGEREPSSSRRPQCSAGPHHLQPELPAGNRCQQRGDLQDPSGQSAFFCPWEGDIPVQTPEPWLSFCLRSCKASLHFRGGRCHWPREMLALKARARGLVFKCRPHLSYTEIKHRRFSLLS